MGISQKVFGFLLAASLVSASVAFASEGSDSQQGQKVEDVVGALKFLAHKTNKTVIQPTYAHLIKPVAIDAAKIARGVERGATYLVVRVKNGSVSMYQQVRAQDDLAGIAEAAAKEATRDAKSTYSLVANTVLKQYVYQEGLKDGVYGLFLKPVGQDLKTAATNTYGALVVVYDHTAKPALNKLKQTGLKVVRVLRASVKVQNNSSAKSATAEDMSEVEASAQDQVIEQFLN